VLVFLVAGLVEQCGHALHFPPMPVLFDVFRTTSLTSVNNFYFFPGLLVHSKVK
jgi:hypothetical protein